MPTLTAAPLFEDSFTSFSGWTDTNTGDANTIGGSGSSLTYSSLTTGSGSASASFGNGTTTEYRNSFAGVSSGQLWISYVGINDTSWAQHGLRVGDSSGSNYFHVGRDFGNTDQFEAGMSWNGWGTDITTFGTGGANDTVADFYLASIDLDADTFEVWVNPTLGGASPSGGQYFNGTVTLGGTWDTLSIISGNATGPSGALFDEVRVGTSFADVAPVPEPSHYALLIGSLALGVAFWRRKRW